MGKLRRKRKGDKVFRAMLNVRVDKIASGRERNTEGRARGIRRGVHREYSSCLVKEKERVERKRDRERKRGVYRKYSTCLRIESK